MHREIQEKISLLKKESISKHCKTALIITVTTKPLGKDITIFPIRYLENYVCLPIGITNDTNAKKLAKYFDGKVDIIFVDVENKIQKCNNLFKKIFDITHRSKIYAIKGNDFSADATFAIVCEFLKPLVGKRIFIIGAGNIGSKVALKLIECGAKVFILNSSKNSTLRTTRAINTIKPTECMDKVLPVINQIFPNNLDSIIGFTRGIPVITKEMILQVKKKGLILDGGTGTIDVEAIEESRRRRLNILKLDIRAGFAAHAHLMLGTEKMISDVYGIRKINNFNIIAGGYLGNIGDIVVDNIKTPKKIIGVADGNGSLLKDQSPYKKNIEIIKKKIL